MSIRLTWFPRTCVDDSLCLHGGKRRISMSMRTRQDREGKRVDEQLPESPILIDARRCAKLSGTRAKQTVSLELPLPPHDRHRFCHGKVANNRDFGAMQRARTRHRDAFREPAPSRRIPIWGNDKNREGLRTLVSLGELLLGFTSLSPDE
ncbi:hypothetical protein ALC62_08375 [Cyphomyrmex costatus]|uniref:Uncharacterized protein n=1 Tax=Cyphomyrmex costatus TaxID=456900 RepID=A0A151IGZ9_9HYME|nr:hypothetical protein ALC62_08375 [Cyphomyrmex costatus]